MSDLASGEYATKGKGLKILTPNQCLVDYQLL